MDATAIARDMAAKKRAKVRALKTVADTDGEVGAWVFQEAKNGTKGSNKGGDGSSRSAWGEYFDAEGNPKPWFKPWSMDDEMNHQRDPLWTEFTEMVLDWQAATPPPTFDEFKANTEAVVS